MLNHLSEFEIEKIVFAKLRGESIHQAESHFLECEECNLIFLHLLNFYKSFKKELSEADYYKVDLLAREIASNKKIIHLTQFIPEIDERILGNKIYLLSAETESLEAKVKNKTFTFASKENNILLRVIVNYKNETAKIFVLSDNNSKTSHCLMGFTDSEKFVRAVTDEEGEIELSSEQFIKWENASAIIFLPEIDYVFDETVITNKQYSLNNCDISFTDKGIDLFECKVVAETKLKFAVVVYRNSSALFTSLHVNRLLISKTREIRQIKFYT